MRWGRMDKQQLPLFFQRKFIPKCTRKILHMLRVASSSLKLLHFGYVSGGKWGMNREVFDKPMEVEVARALESLSCLRWRKRRSKNVDIRWTLIEDVLKALLDRLFSQGSYNPSRGQEPFLHMF